MKKHSETASPTGFDTMSSAIEFADNYSHWILERFIPFLGKNVLEIGTGQGNYSRLLRQHVQHLVSVDIDAKVVERAKQRDPAAEYVVADIGSESFFEKVPRNTFDSVLCINVLEHIANDKAAVCNMLETLKPSGHLLLFIPAHQWLFNDMDRLAGHYRRYSATTLTDLLASQSCERVVTDYFNLIGGLAWLSNKFSHHRSLNSNRLNSQIDFFDKHLVPVSRRLSPLTRSFFGQSLQCIIRKTITTA